MADETSPPVGDSIDPHRQVTVPARGPGLHTEAARQLGRYVLLERLGAGGMGEVYAAFDKTLDRKVALKLLYPAADGAARDEMLAEARALARLSHTAVVTVHDVGVVQERAYIAMEYASGEPLSVWQQKQHWRSVLAAYLEVGEGLRAAHQAGLVHRDFKPNNVVRRDDDRVQLLDFGIAQKAAHPAPDAVPTARIAGTPGYMSPEQMMGLPVDARSDQFSFCVALYEAVHGALPFGETADQPTLIRVRDRQFAPHPEGPAVPRRIDAALRRGLSYQPEHRYPSMGELLKALRRAQPPDRRSWFVLFTVSLLAGLAVAVAWLRPRALCNTGQPAVRAEWAKLRGQLPNTLHGSPQAVQEVLHGVDGWLRSLDDTSSTVCQHFAAARLPADQLALERQCLTDRQGELLVAFESLRGERSVARARDALVQYVPPETCLESAVPGQLARHEHERDAWNAWVKAERALADGDWLQALALSQAAVETARAKGPALLSVALRSEGLAYERLGEPRLAAERLHESARVAVAAGDGVKAAAAWISLARVLGLGHASVLGAPGGGPLDEAGAEVWLDYAQPEVEAHRGWVELAASYELTRAVLDFRRGDRARAAQAVHRASELLPPRHPLKAAVWAAIAATEQRPEALPEAFEVLAAAREDDATPASAWLAMGDWLVLLPKEQAGPAAVKLLEQVRTVLPGASGAAARLHFAVVAAQAGAAEVARGELERLAAEEKNAPAVRAIAALRLHQLVGAALPDPRALAAFPTLAAACQQEPR